MRNELLEREEPSCDESQPGNSSPQKKKQTVGRLFLSETLGVPETDNAEVSPVTAAEVGLSELFRRAIRRTTYPKDGSLCATENLDPRGMGPGIPIGYGVTGLRWGPPTPSSPRTAPSSHNAQLRSLECYSREDTLRRMSSATGGGILSIGSRGAEGNSQQPNVQRRASISGELSCSPGRCSFSQPSLHKWRWRVLGRRLLLLVSGGG